MPLESVLSLTRIALAHKSQAIVPEWAQEFASYRLTLKAGKMVWIRTTVRLHPQFLWFWGIHSLNRRIFGQGNGEAQVAWRRSGSVERGFAVWGILWPCGLSVWLETSLGVLLKAGTRALGPWGCQFGRKHVWGCYKSSQQSVGFANETHPCSRDMLLACV